MYTLVYSSITGNTRRVGEEIFTLLPKGSKIFQLENFNRPIGEDILILGYWVDKGSANKEMEEFIKRLKNKEVILYGTLGADPDSKYGREVKGNVEKLLDSSNKVLGHFLYKSDERDNNNFSKPNEEDLKNIKKFIKNIVN